MAARKTAKKTPRELELEAGSRPVEVIPPREPEPIPEQVDAAKRLEILLKEQAKSQEKAST